jgi:hypothetical protein
MYYCQSILLMESNMHPLSKSLTSLKMEKLSLLKKNTILMGPIEPGFYYFYSFLLISNNTLQPTAKRRG